MERVLLGDEALAQAAIDAGLSCAYGYPGTPSTEIMEYCIAHSEADGFKAMWCTNEKTAYEEALGASLAGKRALVTMKHVGLNVAADAFVNSALLSIHGGLVLCVADDPGMHSSQNEQDTRALAFFAKVPVFEPVTQQQTYEMTREAFDVSERFGVPVIIRMVTRIAHSRATVHTGEKREQNPLDKSNDRPGWMLLPATAKRNWARLLGKETEMIAYAESSSYNRLNEVAGSRLGVITGGLGYNYFKENESDLAQKPSHLHIGFYPLPVDLIRKLYDAVDEILVLEEGYPIIEEKLKGVLGNGKPIHGKLDGTVVRTGELTPDNVRDALGLPKRPHAPSEAAAKATVARPPALCTGCPHTDSYKALKAALEPFSQSLVTSDIGCYSLGALPPHNAIETIVCMGAAIGMAKGASEAGLYPVAATIGDSTFLHGGMTALLDCVQKNADITLMILDNSTVGMTGGQPTMIPSSRFEPLVRGLGVDLAHIRTIVPLPQQHEKNVAVIREEIQYHGLSVIFSVRECIETAKRKARKTK